MTPISPHKVFLDFLQKASCEYLEKLRHYLHRIEKEMTERRNQLKIRIQMLEAEYNANEKAISKSIEATAPKYV